MTRRTSINNVSVKFECPAQLKDDFIECCAYYQISGAFALRVVMQEWIDLYRVKKAKKEKRRGHEDAGAESQA